MQAQTVLTRYKGVRRFVRWPVAEGDIAVDPMANLEQPKPRPHPVDVLTDDEIGRLLKVTDGPDFVDRRDHAMLRVLLDCGLRISELATLTVADVDLKEHDVIRVIGKGRKVRVVPFGAKTGRALDRYRKARPTHKHAQPRRMVAGAARRHDPRRRRHGFKVRAQQAGVDNPHAHRFRHTTAHDWLLAGGQERDLMRIMGWSSDAMLDRYGSSMADQRALEAHRRMRRGDRL